MIFHSVSLKNFKSFPDVEQTVQLNHEGIKLVVAANGYGKTTIFESIIWCLYGKTLQESVDDVVNRYTKRNCKVSVLFSINKIMYSVYRYRNHNTHGNSLYIFEGDKNISLKNISDTQQLIQDIIQIPYNTLINSIIFSTELYTSFFRAKTSERLKIIESILSLKEVNQLYEIDRKKINEYNEKILYQENEKNKLISSSETLKETINRYVETSKKTLISLKKKKEENTIQIKKIKEELKQLQKIDLEKELSLFQIEEFNNNIDKEIEKEKLKDTIGIQKNIEKNEKELEEINSIGDIDELLKQIRFNEELDKEINKINLDISSLKGKIISVEYTEKDLQKIKKEEKRINEEIAFIVSNHCHACGQLINAEKNKELLEKKEKELSSLNSLKEEAINFLTNSTKINEEIKIEIKKIEDEKYQITKKKYFVPFFESDLLNKKESKNIIITDILLYKKELENTLKTNEDIKERILNLQKQKKQVNIVYTKEFLNTLKQNIDNLNKNIINFENENISMDISAKNVFDKSFVEENEKKYKEITKEIKKNEAIISSLKDDLKYYQIMLAVFSNKEGGFKKYFIDKMISVFNSSINLYLPLFFDKNIVITLDKDLNEKIVFDENVISFSSFSSGQKARVEIATSFALFNLVKVFFSSETNLIVMDELLDKNLDSYGFEAVIEVVNGLAKNNSIFIVSHRDELKERFNNKISIKLEDDKFSKII